MKFRKEYDSIGSINVPVDKYWGASTQRSKKYFDIGDFLVRPILIRSIAIIKKAAAIVNHKNKDIDKRISQTIVKVANVKLETSYASEIKSVAKQIIGTCQCLGIKVEGKTPKEITVEVNDGKWDEKLQTS